MNLNNTTKTHRELHAPTAFETIFRPTENKAYMFQLGSEQRSVYCNMDGAGLGDCGGGGWTMVMKIDGNKVFKTPMRAQRSLSTAATMVFKNIILLESSLNRIWNVVVYKKQLICIRNSSSQGRGLTYE